MAKDLEPRTFYLNEQHELSREEKPTGGRPPQYAGIDWREKSARLSASLSTARKAIARSDDPLKDRHHFLLARPVPELSKSSTNVRKAKNGVIVENIAYGDKDSRAFRRLGMDLLQVTESGEAVLHALPERVEQLSSTASELEGAGPREQARWATIDLFEVVPPALRVDDAWLRELKHGQAADAVVEFQPLLTRAEVDELLTALSSLLRRELREIIRGGGSDFSGRRWIRGQLTPESIRAIAKAFYSIQALHSPLRSVAAAKRQGHNQRPTPKPPQVVRRPVEISTLPTVAILDTGVPLDHDKLRAYCRGRFADPLSTGSPVGEHGSFVASRVVFGDHDVSRGGSSTIEGTCRFYDAIVAADRDHIEDKSVLEAMRTVVATAPDVRVFNLSFDNGPLNLLEPARLQQSLILVQDLDNFVFTNDVIVIISAGNVSPGIIPVEPYPQHHRDPQWGLGPWARSFNSLTCGSFVGRGQTDGIAAHEGWPSPFCRVDPGLCDSLKPDFAAPGGDCGADYRFRSGLGVWGMNASGAWEDRVGTSFAAPILAREAAFAAQALQQVCAPGARPFGVTVKAFLALTARLSQLEPAVEELARLTLGRGLASAQALNNPEIDSAILLWQGVLESPDDLARVQIPVPRQWLRQAQAPYLRLVVASDVPANAAVRDRWVSRYVKAALHVKEDDRAMRSKESAHHGHPLYERVYNLGRVAQDALPSNDLWTVELSYDHIADYYPGLDFSPQQRVAFAVELFDRGETKATPQAAIQAMPIAQSLHRLSIPPQIVRAPVVLRVKG